MKRYAGRRTRKSHQFARKVFVVEAVCIVFVLLAMIGFLRSRGESDVAAEASIAPEPPAVEAVASAPFPHTGIQMAAVEAYANQRYGRVAVAVEIPATGQRFAFHGDDPFALHSTFKLALVGAKGFQTLREGREFTAAERNMLTPMIERSENGPAVSIYSELGEAGIQAYLHEVGLTGITPSSVDHWGDSQGTAVAVAHMLSTLDSCLAIGRANCGFAKSLLNGQDDDQYWGIPASLPGDATVRFKNGWYPDYDQAVWRVHSVASVELPGRSDQRATIAVLTEYPISLGYAYGITTTETIGSGVWAALVQGWRPPRDRASVVPSFGQQ